MDQPCADRRVPHCRLRYAPGALGHTRGHRAGLDEMGSKVVRKAGETPDGHTLPECLGDLLAGRLVAVPTVNGAAAANGLLLGRGHPCGD